MSPDFATSTREDWNFSDRAGSVSIPVRVFRMASLPELAGIPANPELRVVGVHLGSMEKDLDAIAAHFDQYPNFAVDTAARMEYLMAATPEKVRAFLIKLSGSCFVRH